MSAVVLRCALGDLDVSTALLRLPVRGNWVAHLELGWNEAPTGRASLLLTREDGSVDTFTGTIRRSGIFAGAELVDVTLVGGAGGLVSEAPPREHAGAATVIPAGVIARGIADDAGEVLAADVEVLLDAAPLQRWTRARMPAGQALDALAAALGRGWRMLADGTLWVGTDTWPEVDATGDQVGGDPRDGCTVYALDGAPLRPGTTIDGVRATMVEYTIAPGRSRARVGSELAGDPMGSPALALYRASYVGEVKAQRPDGTLDIVIEDGRLPHLLAVPFRMGVPGAAADFPAGSRVRVAFEGADPRGAFASAIDQDPAASAPFALVGDDVDFGFLSGTVPAGGGAVTFALSSLASPGSIHLTGQVSGPGHAYLRGVSG